MSCVLDVWVRSGWANQKPGMMATDQWEAYTALPWCCGGIINTGDGTHRALLCCCYCCAVELLLARARPGHRCCCSWWCCQCPVILSDVNITPVTTARDRYNCDVTWASVTSWHPRDTWQSCGRGEARTAHPDLTDPVWWAGRFLFIHPFL